MTTLLAFLATLAILILFHEFGHYLVARLAGVKVLRFSIGFGNVLASRHDRHGTEWALSTIPLGGYVKMLDEREGEVPPELLSRAFNRKGLAARAAIVAAGPLANFLLAILLFWGLFLTGVPVLKPIVGTPPSGTPAAFAGLRPGETVLSVNGEAAESWQDLHLLALKHALRGDELRLETRDGAGHYAERRLTVLVRDEAFEQTPLAALGIVRYLPPLEPVLGELSADGVARQAGLKRGDRVLAVNDHPVADWEEVVDRVRASPGRPVRMQLRRDGQVLAITLTPAVFQDGKDTIGRIGAAPRIDPGIMAPLQGEMRYGPVEAAARAVGRTWELSVFSLEMMGRMVMGQASLKNLSGPITIADYAGQSAESGAAAFIAFLALLSVSLGVLNLLPVPLLDGGHLLYYFAEFVTGRPVSERVQEIGQKIGLGLLGLLMFLAIYNDLQRLFAG